MNPKQRNIEFLRFEPDTLLPVEEGRRRDDFHQIFFIEQGQLRWEVDFMEYVVGEQQVLIIPKQAVHQKIAANALLAYGILFRDEFFSPAQKILLKGFLQYAVALRKLCIGIPTHSGHQLQRYFKLLYEEQKLSDNQNQTFILQNLMLALLNKLEGIVQKTQEENSFIKSRAIFQQFITLVEHHYLQHQHLDFFTRELQVTHRKLNDILKRLTGQTATTFLIDRVMVEAQRMLCFSNKSIKEIAFDLGYENQFYFSRIFKKRIGRSPEQFRNQFAE